MSSKQIRTSCGVQRQPPKIDRDSMDPDFGYAANLRQIRRHYKDCEGSLYWLWEHGGISWPYTMLIGVSEDDEQQLNRVNV